MDISDDEIMDGIGKTVYPTEFKDFIEKPAVYYFPDNPRYPLGARCDNCNKLVKEHFGVDNNIDLCVHCFITVHEYAGLAKLNKPTMKPIKNVDWSEAFLSDPPEFTVYFQDGTVETHDQTTINAELRRQNNKKICSLVIFLICNKKYL